jgi:hypothetical protein
VPIDLFEGVQVEVKTLVAPEGAELPSDEELEAMEAAERAEQEAAAPVATAATEYEYVDDETERVSPADAAMQATRRPRTTRLRRRTSPTGGPMPRPH